MTTRQDSRGSSIDSTEEDRNIKIAIRAVSPNLSFQLSKQGGRIKPVTLAEIRAGLARKASMVAKNKLLEASQQTALLSMQRKGGPLKSPPRTPMSKPAPPIEARLSKDLPEAPNNPLFAIIRASATSSMYSSPSLLASPTSARSSRSPSSPEHEYNLTRGSKQIENQRLPLQSNSFSPNCIEYISNQPSSTQAIEVPPSIIANAGWDVIPVTIDQIPFRIGPILMMPELPEQVMEESATSSTESSPHPIKQTSLLAVEDTRVELSLQEEQVDSEEDTLLKLYDYFSVNLFTPKESRTLRNSLTVKEFNLPSSPLSSKSFQDIPIYPPKLSTMPEKISPKKVHFAASPNLSVINFEEEPDSVHASIQKKTPPSHSLEKRDQNAYQSQICEMQRGRGDSFDGTQWSSDSDTSSRLRNSNSNSKLKNFKDMLWR